MPPGSKKEALTVNVLGNTTADKTLDLINFAWIQFENPVVIKKTL